VTWTNEHGPDGLYDKFRVQRVSTGDWLPENRFVFVLLPEFDEAAVEALYTYCEAVEHRAPELAQQLRDKLIKIELDNGVV
jgi:hypothetical protein